MRKPPRTPDSFSGKYKKPVNRQLVKQALNTAVFLFKNYHALKNESDSLTLVVINLLRCALGEPDDQKETLQ